MRTQKRGKGLKKTSGAQFAAPDHMRLVPRATRTLETRMVNPVCRSTRSVVNDITFSLLNLPI